MKIPKKRSYYPVTVILVGLFCAQLLSLLMVHRSNVDLHRTLTSLDPQNYLIVPNQHVIPQLIEIMPALFGGLFFTLTAGAGLTILALGATWCWDRLFFRNTPFFILLFCLWIGYIGFLNINGFTPLVTAIFVIIPIAVFATTLRSMPPREKISIVLSRAAYVLPLVFFLGAGAWITKGRPFTEVRDYLLLPTAVGRQVNDFYYRYTLYPAQVFKSLSQKTIRTAAIDTVEDDLRPDIENLLLAHDFLLMEDPAVADLTVRFEKNRVLLSDKGRLILKVKPEKFLTDPADWLRSYSNRTDRYLFFRPFVYYSLLAGMPLIFYILMYALWRRLWLMRFSVKTSSILASVSCCLVCAALLIPLYIGGHVKVDITRLEEALTSTRWQERVAAMKVIIENKVEIGDFESYPLLLTTAHLTEKYWLARTLGVSRRPNTYRDLVALLDDPNPNVVCMALDALKRRGDPAVIDQIIARINTSDHWYVQLYAYGALKVLGWTQPGSG